jgi:DNA modification methylase
MSKQKSLFKTKVVPGKPGSGNLFEEEIVFNDRLVKCLGLEFENDDTRRTHFTEELRKKLQDPEFRKIEGFPIGEDVDILNLSDPPYYTACPNPWITDFIEEWESQKPEKSADYHYHREPFAADVSEGKNDPIYNAHSYHTKVPHKAIMHYILHYTEPGDIVFDGFCGTGMTGVAAQMCGDRNVVVSLGYQVKPDGTILQEETDENGQKVWSPFSKLGARKAVLNDLSPVATFIAGVYNSNFNLTKFEKACDSILKQADSKIKTMYTTIHPENNAECEIEYVVWSEVFLCPHCTSELNFFECAIDQDTKKVKPGFNCPNCGDSSLNKKTISKKYEQVFDTLKGNVFKREKRVPVQISYLCQGKRYIKKPTEYDFDVLKKVESSSISANFPMNKMMNLPDDVEKWGDKWRAGTASFTHVHHLFLKRPALAADILWSLASNWKDKSLKNALLFFVEQAILGTTVLNRHHVIGRANVNQWLTGVYYVPSLYEETSYNRILKGKLKRLVQAFNGLCELDSLSIINTGSIAETPLEPNSIDYIFTDPPFGDNLAYSELNFVLEAFHKVFTNQRSEAVISKFQSKLLREYQSLMKRSFQEYYRVIKPGRWMTVEFSNTKASVWNSIQTALTESGFIVANVSALDKKQGSFNAYTNQTSVKQDLVISAYKPNGSFEDRFKQEVQTEEGVWDFIRAHLKYLPVTKKQGFDFLTIPERDPRILYDQVIGYYVHKGYNVPIDSQEFQLGLLQRFSERDGMYFLPEQVAEYDRKKMIGGGRPLQQSLFISDEATAIAWLRSLLRDKPQSFQDINPQFMKEISGWSKSEVGLELSTLLEQNFLPYEGKGPVPDQIHSYLSTNWKDMRNLPKDDSALIAKAKGRWYVPDPNKAGDLEKLREKALLKEFEEYKQVKKKLKIFRLEAVRAGFKKAWQDRDYAVIINVAEKIPNHVLEEDPKLLMWYDQATTRMEII